MFTLVMGSAQFTLTSEEAARLVADGDTLTAKIVARNEAQAVLDCGGCQVVTPAFADWRDMLYQGGAPTAILRLK